MPVSALTRGGVDKRELGVVDRGDRRDGRAARARLLARRRVGHAEEAGELGAGVRGGDRDVRERRAVGVRGAGCAGSCSVKKHTALPRSAHDPPPNDTTASTPSRRACCTAFCTSGTGTCDVTSANVEANALPSAPRTCPPSSLALRPSVVTNSARRDAERAQQPAHVAHPPGAEERAVARSPVCVHVGGHHSHLSQQVGLGDARPLAAADEPLGAEPVREAPPRAWSGRRTGR